jgi:hypothetical protein
MWVRDWYSSGKKKKKARKQVENKPRRRRNRLTPAGFGNVVIKNAKLLQHLARL